MTREIPLTRGFVALVDDEDFDWLNQWKWYADSGTGTWYARRSLLAHEGGAKRSVAMHRVILGVPDGVFVDHADHCGINNQRSNLRSCSSAENNRNTSYAPGASGYRGVHWDAGKQTWRAEIWVNSRKVRRAGFTDPAEAARVRDELAKSLHGEFAVLNFPHQAEAD